MAKDHKTGTTDAVNMWLDASTLSTTIGAAITDTAICTDTTSSTVIDDVSLTSHAIHGDWIEPAPAYHHEVLAVVMAIPEKTLMLDPEDCAREIGYRREKMIRELCEKILTYCDIQEEYQYDKDETHIRYQIHILKKG